MDEKNKNTDKSAAARILEATKGRGTTDTDDISVDKVTWLDNFWYHNKWKTIIISFFVVVFAIMGYQLLTKEKADVNILYCGPVYINHDKNEAVRTALKSVMSTDYNGDGKKGILFTNLTYLNEEQIADKLEEAKRQGINSVFNYSENAKALQVYDTEIIAGEHIVLFLDPSLYEELKTAAVLMPLKELFGDNIPEESLDEYGINLSKTKYYKYFTDAQVFPEDTVLCIRRLSNMSYFKGKSKADKIYGHHLQFFKDIVNFDYPEGYIPE